MIPFTHVIPPTNQSFNQRTNQSINSFQDKDVLSFLDGEAEGAKRKQELRQLLKDLVLFTDMSLHAKIMEKLNEVCTEGSKSQGWREGKKVWLKGGLGGALELEMEERY